MFERRLDWKAACLFVFSDPQWRTKIFRGGLWLLLCPPVGWLMALGYRKEVVMNLVQGQSPVLPAWPGRSRRFFTEGAKAVGVILVYFCPFFLLFWGWAAPDLDTLVEGRREVLLFFLGVVALAPICLPALPVWYVQRYEWLSLGAGEAAALVTLFVATTYVIPAGFMQVSRTGRFRDALRLPDVVRVLRRHPAAYTEAWICSGFMTMGALAAGPLAPFAIIWSYQGIVYCFNEVLTASTESDVQARLANSHFEAYGRRRQPRSREEMAGLLGTGRSTPTLFAVGAATYAVSSLTLLEEGVEVTMRGRTGACYRAVLSTVWRPHLTVRKGLFAHYVDVSRRGDALEVRPVAAAVCFGPVQIPLPRRLAPRYRPQAVAPGEPSWRP